MKKPEVIEWADLQIGDFVESSHNRMFCFKRDDTGPSCCGMVKNPSKINSNEHTFVLTGGILEYRRMKPSKSFLKLCKRMVNLNYKEYHLDNLSYVEALAALKKYD